MIFVNRKEKSIVGDFEIAAPAGFRLVRFGSYTQRILARHSCAETHDPL
jgi:hypothetical protein